MPRYKAAFLFAVVALCIHSSCSIPVPTGGISGSDVANADDLAEILLSSAHNAADWTETLSEVAKAKNALPLDASRHEFSWQGGQQLAASLQCPSPKLCSLQVSTHGSVVYESQPGKEILSGSPLANRFSQDSGFIATKDALPVWCGFQTIEQVSFPENRTREPSLLNLRGSGCFGLYLWELNITSSETAPFAKMQYSMHSTYAFPLKRIKLTMDRPWEQGNGLFGGGEQFGLLNLEGQRLRCMTTEKGVGRGLQPLSLYMDLTTKGKAGKWYTTYTYTPALIARNGWTMSVVDGFPYTVLDDSSKFGEFSIEVESSKNTLAFSQQKGAASAVQALAKILGLPKRLPDWAHEGAIVGLELGQESVMKGLDSVEKAVQEYNMSFAGVWIQDWSGMRVFPDRIGLWWNWQLDEKQYSDFPAISERCKDLGGTVLTYVNPLLVNLSAHQDAPASVKNWFVEAAEKNLFVKEPNGKIWLGYNGAGLVDVTEPNGFEWMVNLIVNEVLLPGVKGFMADFGESYPLDVSLDKHNELPTAWAKVVEEAFKRAAINDGVAFMRSGSLHTQQHVSLFWAGDQLISWDGKDGLRSGVRGMLTGGLTGRPVTHSDIGGYTTVVAPYHIPYKVVRSKELLMRWCEMAAFTPVYRSHPGSDPRPNWQFNSDDETLRHFAKFQKAHSCWAPIRRKLLDAASSTGMPVMRAMILGLPAHDQVALTLDSQFMLGPEVVVAPQLDQSGESVDVYLPAGEWRRAMAPPGAQTIWPSNGPNAQWARAVPTPMGHPAVFVLSDGSGDTIQFADCLDSL